MTEEMKNENVTEATETEEIAAVETPISTVLPTPVVKAAKKALFKIYLDENGNEEKRVPMTKGKHPFGSYKDAEGNLVIPKVEKPKPVVAPRPDIFVITLDENGNEISRERKTRGRGPAGYTKQESGPYAGHWTGTKTPAVSTQPAPQVVVNEVTETTESVTSDPT